ncbi:hypothetical protein CYMTET_16406 [Cymbomonas tetramitiformis]|uniref:Serine aminopeptidase S33 domain-containing protein n=1 Tax=Cymbomonas tetramitiformis TaxID=36881 RepID=A0AAE0GCB0_9CHLO|nr:hypothetical protein CYMTET_16406 [Cymbomonas tetramitiformis]
MNLTHPSINGLHGHRWGALGVQTPNAVIALCHGYAAHGAYPTIVYLAEVLASRGFEVVSVDFTGHGRSKGIRALVPSSDSLLHEGTALFNYAEEVAAQYTKTLKVFLLGTSMGGAVALRVANRVGTPRCAGTVLLAPMVSIAAENIPSRWLFPILRCVACMLPWIAVVPGNASDSSVQYRDPERRQICDSDPLTYHGRVRLGTGVALIDTQLRVQEEMSSISCPLFIIHGTADTVVMPAKSEDLHERVASLDKKLWMIPGALHGLMCEPEGTRVQIEKEIVQWLTHRC